MVTDKILYCKDGRTHPYWRIILPRQLETRVIRYVHSLLGHQGTDECMVHPREVYECTLLWPPRAYVASDLCS
jgi:hypothetical protein